jgi:hypothetical protein
MFHTYTPLDSQHVVGIGRLAASGEGSVKLQFRIGTRLTTVTLARVLYLPSSPYNILSLGKLHRAGYELEFPFGSDDVIISKNGSRLAHCHNIGDVYALGNVMPVRRDNDEYKYQPAVPTDPTPSKGEYTSPVNGAPLAKAHSKSSPSGTNTQTPGYTIRTTSMSPLTPSSSHMPTLEQTPPPPKAPRDIDSTISTDNIILGPRTRKYTKPGSFLAILHAPDTSHGGISSPLRIIENSA